MKGLYLEVLDQVADSHSEVIPKQYGLMIYGSTVMRQMSKDNGGEYYFPLAGVKSSDIDIGGCYNGGKYSGRNTTTKEEFQRYFAPLLAKATKKAGFDLWIPDRGFTGESKGTIKDKIANADINDDASFSFVGDYYIAMKFTREQIVEALQHHPDYKKIEPYIISHFDTKGREYKTVCIAISAHDEHFPAMMKPDFLFHKGQFDYARMIKPRYLDDMPLVGMARRYDMLAGKLARSMGANFKPTDLIDIYNLIKGHQDYQSAEDPDVYWCVSAENRIDLQVIRLLTINYLMLGYRQLDTNSPSLLDNFKNTPENKAKVITKLKTQIVEFRQQEVFDKLDEIYEEVSTFVSAIFGKIQEGSYWNDVPKYEVPDEGLLNLTQGERNYIACFHGYQPMVADEVELDKTFWQKLLRRPADTKIALVAKDPSKPSEASIAVDELVATYRLVFSVVYEMDDMFKEWLSKNTLLNQKLQFNKYGAEVASGPGADY